MFPPGIDDPKHTPLRRAQARLKFLLQLAALRRYNKASLHRLANDAGIDHSTLFSSIKRGHFTHATADKLEMACGRGELRREALLDPMHADQAAIQ